MIELDDRAALRRDADLRQLLKHYVDLAKRDKEAWHDRVMPPDTEQAVALSKRHGKLLSCGWLEQQTGVLSRLAINEVAGCYRATPAGRSVIKEIP